MCLKRGCPSAPVPGALTLKGWPTWIVSGLTQTICWALRDSVPVQKCSRIRNVSCRKVWGFCPTAFKPSSSPNLSSLDQVAGMTCGETPKIPSLHCYWWAMSRCWIHSHWPLWAHPGITWCHSVSSTFLEWVVCTFLSDQMSSLSTQWCVFWTHHSDRFGPRTLH